MAERKISELSEISSTNTSDVVPVVSGGTTVKAQLQNLVKASFVGSDGDSNVQADVNSIRNERRASLRTINVFNDGFTVDGANFNTYMGKNNIYGAARDKVVQVRLPTEAHVTTAGASYPLEIEFQHFAGTQRSTTTNQIVIATQNNEELRESSSTGNIRTSYTMQRGDTAVFTKSAAGQPWIVTMGAMDPRSSFLPDSVFTLNTRTIGVALSGGDYQIFGLTSITPAVGDAFEVDRGGIPAGQDFPEIEIGDVLVSKVSNPSLTLNTANDDWLIIRDIHNFPLNLQEIRFLSQVSEIAGGEDANLVEDLTNDALVWLSPAVLATAPFLTPSGDGDNPRTPEVIAYIGGREDRNSNNEFEFASDRPNSYVYVGITPAYITSKGEENVDVVVKNPDDSEAARYSLANDFVFTDESDFTNPTVRHYFYSTDGTNPATINYTAQQTIEIWEVNRQTHYRLNANTVDTTQNIENLLEAQLNSEVQIKLNSSPGSHEDVDEQRLSTLEEKMDNLYPLTPDVGDLTEWADIWQPDRSTSVVEITDGYSLIADYRGASTRYESAGVTYSDAGTDVVRYTGLGNNLYRTFGFKVPQVDTITLTGTSGTANIDVSGTNYLATFNTNLTTTASDFVTTHSSALNTAGIIVTSSGAVLTFTQKIGATARSSIGITNATGDLAGTVSQNVVPNQVLMWIVDGATLIPFIDVTSASKFRINNYTPATTANQTVTDEIHFLTRTSGSAVVSTSDGSLSTFTITPFPSSSTDTSRRMQVDVDIYVNGTDTEAGDFIEEEDGLTIPATNTAQAKQTITKDVYLGPLHGNRTVRVTIGYELRVSGSDLLVDFTLEGAPSDVTVAFTDVAVWLTYTAPATVSRVDNWEIFQDAGGDYTFTGGNDLLVTFQPHQSTGFLNAVAAAIGSSGSATQLNDRITPIPANDFASVEIPDQTAFSGGEFRTFSPVHFLRHSDVAELLTRRATQWCYGLALLRPSTEHAVTSQVDFTQGIVLTSPNATRYILTVANDGSLKTDPA